MVLSYADVKARLNWGETNELEFKPEPTTDQAFRDYVFESVVGMANTVNGTLVLGVSESIVGGRTTRKIEGVSKAPSDISDKLMKLVNEYTEPHGLRFTSYPITEVREPPLIGIDVKRVPGEHYAVRYDGIASQKMTSYYFFLRLNGETKRVTYQTFMTYVYGNLVGDLKGAFGEAPKQPELVIECLEKRWYKRKPTSTATTIELLLRFDNKGDGSTTVHSIDLSIEHKGQTISDASKLPPLNIMLEPGASIPTRFEFQIPVDKIQITGTIEKVVLTIKHTRGQNEIEIKSIEQRQN